MLYRFLGILYCVFCFTSCNKLKEGIIIEKWYEPTRKYVSVMPISTGKTIIMIPYIITDYEDWCIKIKGKYKNEERIETIYVSQKLYENLKIGSNLKLNNDYYMLDNNNSEVPK